MASLWFSVIVVTYSLQQVFASERNCTLGVIRRCDECIRCNGIWCHTPDENGVQCSTKSDSSCPYNQETTPVLLQYSEINGIELYPKYIEQTVKIENTHTIRILYPQTAPSSGLPKKPHIDMKIVNSTIPGLKLKPHLHIRSDFTQGKHCVDGKCLATISITPTTQFCPVNGTESEMFTLRVQVEGATEEFNGRFHVPCACGCSKDVVRSAPNCNGRGDYVCGSCSCSDGWKGVSCEQDVIKLLPLLHPQLVKSSPLKSQVAKSPSPNPPKTSCDRGDTPDCSVNNMVCSNNGLCVCGRCECFTNSTVEYFGDFCEDICTFTSNCESCIRTPTEGPCDDCYFDMTIDPTNETLLRQDSWTKCQLEDECFVNYAAMRSDGGKIHVMVTSTCNGIAGATGVVKQVNVVIPVVLGVIALVAAAAAVAGYMVWKNRTPPLPLNEPGYQNIDAEDCTGMNPLYKPPTSSFKNPTYGNKW